MTTVLKAILEKRSVDKNIFLVTPGYHKRWFVLDNEALSYYDGNESKMKEKKGEIKLTMMYGVEAVDDNVLDGKNNVLQIIHQTRGRFDFLKLYLVTKSKSEQEKWIRGIRKGALSAGAKFLKNFHPGVWINGAFTCCKRQSALSKGCQLVHLSEDGITTGDTTEKRERSAACINRPPPEIPQTSVSSGDHGSFSDSVKRPPSKEIPAFKKLYSANYGYQPTSTVELELVKGNLYEVEDNSPKDWWYATDYQNGKTGEVPMNYLQEVTSPEHYKWYFGGLSKEECQSALQTDKRTGCFLVRLSSDNSSYTFSFFDGVTIRSYRIQNQDSNKIYIIKAEQFSSVPELIEYYHRHTIGTTGCTLTCFPRHM